MGVATCTVRKHLEHAYPKLGVTNRLAAAVAMRGESLATPELRDRLAVND
jgi:DNA-binding NarL/FixJ family response regulator